MALYFNDQITELNSLVGNSNSKQSNEAERHSSDKPLLRTSDSMADRYVTYV